MVFNFQTDWKICSSIVLSASGDYFLYTIITMVVAKSDFLIFIIPTSGWLVVFLKKGFSLPLGTSCFKCIIIMDAKISFLFSMLKLISAIIHFTALIIPHLASGRSFKVVPASLWHVFISSSAPDQLLSKKVWVLLVRNSNLVSKICVLGMLITFRISLLPGFCSRQN